MVAHTGRPACRQAKASTSRLGTATTGSRHACAMALAELTPTRRPVNSPGPVPTAIPPRAAPSTPARSSTWWTMGTSSSAWARSLRTAMEASVPVSEPAATLVTGVAVSMPRTSNGGASLFGRFGEIVLWHRTPVHDRRLRAPVPAGPRSGRIIGYAVHRGGPRLGRAEPLRPGRARRERQRGGRGPGHSRPRRRRIRRRSRRRRGRAGARRPAGGEEPGRHPPLRVRAPAPLRGAPRRALLDQPRPARRQGTGEGAGRPPAAALPDGAARPVPRQGLVGGRGLPAPGPGRAGRARAGPALQEGTGRGASSRAAAAPRRAHGPDDRHATAAARAARPARGRPHRARPPARPSPQGLRGPGRRARLRLCGPVVVVPRPGAHPGRRRRPHRRHPRPGRGRGTDRAAGACGYRPRAVGLTHYCMKRDGADRDGQLGRDFEEEPMPVDPKTAARERIERAREHLLDLSHRIHARPELGMEEAQACAWLCDALTGAGFAVERGVGGLETAFSARSGPGPLRVVVCAEYDALPGIGHACGHNVIAAMAAGAGMGLAAVADEVGVEVTVLGTPDEEAGGGKITLLERGAFDGAHAAMMVHPAPFDIVEMPIIAADQISVRYRGKEAHAAAFPELGVNAADALVVAQTAIGLLRQHLRATDRVHGF